MSCYEDLQSLMRARFLLEMAGLGAGMPTGTDRIYRILWSNHTLLAPQSVPTN